VHAISASVLLLLLLVPAASGASGAPGVAPSVASAVPARFQGEWCTQPSAGDDDTGESGIAIAAHAIGYYRGRGRILLAAALGDQLALIVRLHEDGRTWLATEEFEISADGSRLTSPRADGRIRTRVRCQPSSQSPPAD